MAQISCAATDPRPGRAQGHPAAGVPGSGRNIAGRRHPARQDGPDIVFEPSPAQGPHRGISAAWPGLPSLSGKAFPGGQGGGCAGLDPLLGRDCWEGKAHSSSILLTWRVRVPESALCRDRSPARLSCGPERGPCPVALGWPKSGRWVQIPALQEGAGSVGPLPCAFRARLGSPPGPFTLPREQLGKTCCPFLLWGP